MTRNGIGYDLHRLEAGRKLILGGVEVPFDRGPAGHSDGDVLAHAICDALLGAAGLRILTQVPRMRLLAITEIPPGLYVQTFALGITLGVLGGLLPAYRASRIMPVEALRYE